MIQIITGVFLSQMLVGSYVSGKLFSTIINRRLQMWVDMNDTIGEQQAGFSKGLFNSRSYIYLACYCTKNNCL